MDLPAQISGSSGINLPARPLYLAIGMFDGVHLGHRAVVEAAVQSARASDALSGVLTFSPHPSVLFRPESPTLMIQDDGAKARLLIALGIDIVITQTFDATLAAMDADEFLPWLKQSLPRLAAIYVGENFRFGARRRGDVALLVAAGRQQGVRVFSAPRVNLDGEPISSTRIRSQLMAGDVEAANALLGYHYFSEGLVTGGKRLGRTIGFPTLNVPWSPELKPRFGVYAVRVTGPNSRGLHAAVANYGLRPTVEHSVIPRLEVHLLGECPFSTGDAVKVEWLRFMRPEMKFVGLEELKAQIGRDREAARVFFAA